MLSRKLVVDAPDRVAALLDAKRRRILVAFMGGERSLSQAADSLAMPLNRLAYHAGALLRLGLIAVVREQKRAGRPIRHYRAVADSFRVPAAAMGRRAGDGLAAELRASLERADILAGVGDLLLDLDADGRPRLLRRGGEVESEACEYWRVLALDRAEARSLGRELGTLLRRYESAPGKGRTPYLVHAALAPRRPD